MPFDVVSMAAELVSEDDELIKRTITADQLKFINMLCRKADRQFSFDEQTLVVSVSLLVDSDSIPFSTSLPPPPYHSKFT